MTSTSRHGTGPGRGRGTSRVAALFEDAARVNLGVVVVAPPDATRESARDAATTAATVAGRGALLREATAAAREIVLKAFANAGFSGTWAVTEMSMSVATAADRVAAVAAFEEATVAAVAEDLVDADTLDVLRRHVGPDRELECHPVTRLAVVHRRDRSGRRPEPASRSRSSRESSSSAPWSASPSRRTPD